MLKEKLSSTDFDLILKIVNKAYEHSFIKHKNKLKKKFELLQRRRPPPPPAQPPRPSTINNPVHQLQLTKLQPEIVSLLEKGPKFAVTPKTIPYMDIIHETEKAAISLASKGLHEQGEKLRQDVSKVLQHSINNPHLYQSNLDQHERKGLSILNKKIKNKEIVVAPHDKGIGFVTLEPDSLKQKAYAAFQNVTSDIPDETNKLEGQIQRKLLKLKKDRKLNEQERERY